MSSLDRSRSLEPASSWRCPRCRSLQLETTRCWRCHTVAFTCETCSFYRLSVAADLGTCAADPGRAPVRAHETRSCWDATGVTALTISGSPVARAPGLFAESEMAAPVAAAAAAPKPVPAAERAAGTVTRSRSKPPLEGPGRAAWVEPRHDALVDAPMVEPGERLSTEVRRRRRRWFR